MYRKIKKLLNLNKVLKNSTEYFAKQYSNGEIKNAFDLILENAKLNNRKSSR